jgi:arabinofuranosyltransferase
MAHFSFGEGREDSRKYHELMNRRLSPVEIAVLLASFGVAALGFYTYRAFYHDDAYISLRYVYNFLHGHGLVWNTGERVEGYSNFLMVILTSLLGWLHIGLVAASKAVGVTSSIGLCAYAAWYVRMKLPRRDRSAPLWLIPVVMIVTSLPLIIWSIGGLETVLFAALATAAIWTFATSLTRSGRAVAIAGVLFALAALTRPEGFLFFGISLVYGLAAGGGTMREKIRRALELLIPFFALIIPHLVFQLAYYGDLVPNTWYVKGGMTWDKFARGMKYLYEFSLSLPFLVPISILGAAVLVIRRRFNTTLGYLGIIIFLYLAYVAVIGGDHMPAFRFLSPIIPTLALFIFLTVRAFPSLDIRPRSLLLTLAIVVLSFGQTVFPHEIVRRAKITDGAAFIGKIVGEYIENNWPHGSLVALNTAGSTPYYAPDLRFIDMLGLNDTTIARRKNVPMVAFYQWVPGHEKGDGAYVLSRKPQYIIAGGSNGDKIIDLWFLTEYELARMPAFKEQYELKGVLLPTTGYPGYENYIETRQGTLRFLYYERKE